MAGAQALTDHQRDQEQSIRFALILDCGILAAFILTGILTGALTMIAESIRGSLVLALEAFALLMMRRIHRGRTLTFEFGSGKIEQTANLMLAGGMLVGAAWIAFGAIELITGHSSPASPGGYTMAAIFATINTAENAVAWDAMRRAERGSGSIIMKGQLHVRLVKVISSVAVQLALTMAALATDPLVSAWADAGGALVVTAFIAHSAIGMIREGLPDLLDQSVNEQYQLAITRMLARHFDDYDRLDRVRTRRSGHVIHAEVTLAFDGGLTMAEIDRRITAMKATLQTELPEVDVAIVAGAC